LETLILNSMLDFDIHTQYFFEKSQMQKFIDKIKRNVLEQPKFIPTTKEELEQIGWYEIDVLLITGDAYIDHPSFGVSIIGRVLIAAGYRVGIIAQPDWHNSASIKILGIPKIACAISSGNMDSMLNIYTAARRLRKKDAFSPGGKINLRPPRSLIAYANLARSAFSEVPIIIGGIEASMRRFSHYDYWKDKILPSILVNTKAELLIYGMGEKAIVEAIDMLKSVYFSKLHAESQPQKGYLEACNENRLGYRLSADKYKFASILGTVRMLGKKESLEFADSKGNSYRKLPPYKEILSIPGALLLSHKIIEEEMNPYSAKGIMQPYEERIVVAEPPPMPLSTLEMDFIYNLPYAGLPHPKYNKKIPAYEMIKDSIVSVRGCPGGCSFCGLGLHQGKFISSRSEESILSEAQKLASKKVFHGTISDIGGPTANAYGNKSVNLKVCMNCRRPSCLFPEICSNYLIDESKLLNLLKKVSRLPKIKHVFLNSGIRLDLALHQKKLMKSIIKNNVSGHLKVAPEHLDKQALNLMRKNAAEDFFTFMKFFDKETRAIGKKQYIVPYFISNFPGCDDKAAETVDRFLSKTRWALQQVQDFIPLPMTIASAMYYECLDYNGNSIKVNKGLKERRHQLAMLKGNRN